MRLTRTSALLTMIVITVTALPAFADANVNIPAKAISAKTIVVGYVNFDAVTPNAIKATAQAFTGGIPDQSQALRQQMNAGIESGMAKLNKIRADLTNAHVHGMLFGAAPAVNKTAAQHFMLIQGDSSTTLQSLTAAMKKASAQGNLDKQPPKISRFSGNWFAVQNKENQLPQNGGDDKTASRFQNILNHAAGPVRVAFIMNRQAHQALTKMQANPGMASAFAAQLQSLDHGTLTFKPGKAPALDVNLTFKDAQSASAAGTTLAGMLNIGQSMIKSRLTQMPNAPAPKLIDSLFSDLQPKVNGKNLAMGLHKSFIHNLGKLVPVVAPMVRMMIQARAMQQHGMSSGIPSGIQPGGIQGGGMHNNGSGAANNKLSSQNQQNNSGPYQRKSRDPYHHN